MVEARRETGDGPRQQFGDTADGVVGDDAEHVAQVGFRVDPVQLGGLQQGGDRGGPGAARVAAGEEPILAPKYQLSGDMQNPSGDDVKNPATLRSRGEMGCVTR